MRKSIHAAFAIVALSSPVGAGEWRFARDVSPIDDKEAISIVSSSATADLWIVCRDRTLYVAVSSNKHLSLRGDFVVRYRIDNSAPRAFLGEASAAMQAGASHYDSAAEVIGHMLRGTQMSAELEIFYGPRMYFEFALSGLDASLAPIRKACPATPVALPGMWDTTTRAALPATWDTITRAN
jgi:hypothetical protein